MMDTILHLHCADSQRQWRLGFDLGLLKCHLMYGAISCYFTKEKMWFRSAILERQGLEVGLARCFKVEKSFSGSDKKEQKGVAQSKHFITIIIFFCMSICTLSSKSQP